MYKNETYAKALTAEQAGQQAVEEVRVGLQRRGGRAPAQEGGAARQRARKARRRLAGPRALRRRQHCRRQYVTGERSLLTLHSY